MQKQNSTKQKLLKQIRAHYTNYKTNLNIGLLTAGVSEFIILLQRKTETRQNRSSIPSQPFHLKLI